MMNRNVPDSPDIVCEIYLVAIHACDAYAEASASRSLKNHDGVMSYDEPSATWWCLNFKPL
jgi:hypothetical protein